MYDNSLPFNFVSSIFFVIAATTAQLKHAPMKKLLLITGIITSSIVSSAQITLLGSFSPSIPGGLCGIGYDPLTAQIWLYGCSDSQFHRFDTTGTLLNSYPVPGGSANDVDIEIAPVQLMISGATVPQGEVLFINGESGAAEVYAINNITGTIEDTLTSAFGNSHVVGGAYHPQRNTFFLVQDNVPGAPLDNVIAEIDPLNGDTLHTYRIGNNFNVSYGDLEVGCNGNLFVVSSVEDSIAEFSPDGVFIKKHRYPIGSNNFSGIAIDCNTGDAWLCNNAGVVYHFGVFPGGTGIDENDNRFSISNIHPNPFSNETHFSISMKQQGNLKVTITDLSGRVISYIYNEETTAGIKEFSFSGDLAAGTYLLLAEMNGITSCKKMIVTK